MRLDGERVYVTSVDGVAFQTVEPRNTELCRRTAPGTASRSAAAPQEQSGFVSALGLWLPFLLLIGVGIFVINRMQKGGGRGGGDGLRQVEGEAPDREATAR